MIFKKNRCLYTDYSTNRHSCDRGLQDRRIRWLLNPIFKNRSNRLAKSFVLNRVHCSDYPNEYYTHSNSSTNFRKFCVLDRRPLRERSSSLGDIDTLRTHRKISKNRLLSVENRRRTREQCTPTCTIRTDDFRLTWPFEVCPPTRDPSNTIGNGFFSRCFRGKFLIPVFFVPVNLTPGFATIFRQTGTCIGRTRSPRSWHRLQCRWQTRATRISDTESVPGTFERLNCTRVWAKPSAWKNRTAPNWERTGWTASATVSTWKKCRAGHVRRVARSGGDRQKKNSATQPVAARELSRLK